MMSSLAYRSCVAPDRTIMMRQSCARSVEVVVCSQDFCTFAVSFA